MTPTHPFYFERLNSIIEFDFFKSSQKDNEAKQPVTGVYVQHMIYYYKNLYAISGNELKNLQFSVDWS
jgi:hypothetical protein